MTSRRTTIFCLQTAQSKKYTVPLQFELQKNSITYQTYRSFLNDYHQILLLDDMKQCRFATMLAQ